VSPAEWQGDDYQAQFDMLAASGQDVHVRSHVTDDRFAYIDLDARNDLYNPVGQSLS
jgi:hypothetical protein